MNSSVSIASWNVNNRVGRVLFKPDAALAAIALETDIVVLNEFYPGTSEAVFRQRLADGGLQYQVMSMDTGARANRVLIASREPIGPLRLDLPRFDDQFAANIAAVRVLRADW